MSCARGFLRWRVVAVLPMAMLAGCASQGPLRPPSLFLPDFAEKLTVERVGGELLLQWNTPSRTTDGEKVKGAVSANICVDEQPNPAATAASAPKRSPKGVKRAGQPATAADVPACKAVQHVAVAPGASKATAELPAALQTGPPRLVAVSVELQNWLGKSAGPSPAVYVAAGAAPAAVGALTISGRRESALVQWKPSSDGAAMELKRTLVATAAGPVADKPAAPATKAAPNPFAPGSSKGPANEVVLRGDEGKDAGGIIDPSVRDGSTYTYVAQRVLTVTLAGHQVELRGAASPATTFVYHDVAPPRAPVGLVTVPGGGFGEAPSIDLAWDANLENDVAGYNVYRDAGAGFVRINAELVPAPAYRDMQVQPGRQYTYRVTAVDARRNESAPSATVNETLRR